MSADDEPGATERSQDYVSAVLAKAESGGAHPIELAALRRRLKQLAEPSAGQLPSDSIEPVPDLPHLEDLPQPADPRSVLDRLVVLKLNGGLGTSMGLSGPKSTLEVKPGARFLDIIARQVLALRREYGARLPLLLMNSPGTREASLDVLGRHDGLDEQDVPLDFLQGREPKLDAATWLPVEWTANPDLEWCPPGHGDVYTALAASGILATVLESGLRWCFVSNADNLGAMVDARIPAWMAEHDIPFAMETVRGTAADRKGGHLARKDGRLLLRETAQVPEGDTSFTDVERWRFYNTNNLWVDLAALADLQESAPGGPPLPLIVNRKTVDPTDKASTPVIQLETAMGAAIGAIDGAQALLVPRTRFAPVKTTDDLLVVRSDAYDLTEDGRMVPAPDTSPPVVTLDPEYYRMLADFESRFPSGPPSLRHARSLQVRGDVEFGADVTVEGEAEVHGPRHVAAGTVLRG